MSNEELIQEDIDPGLAVEYFWRKGSLSFLLDENQKELYKAYHDTKRKILVWNLCRGAGKSFLLCVLATEICLQKPRTIVKYGCSTKEQARQIIEQVMFEVIKTCPEDIKPEYKVNEHAYRFANGSQIQLGGLDGGEAERLRGGSSRLGIIDEAAMVNGSAGKGDLDYIVKSIMIPAVTRHKRINGKLILASTPPKDEKHPFVKYIRKAEYEKTLATKTIYQCPRYTKEMIDELAYELGGYNSPDFRREYLCELVRDASSTVIPEFNKDLELRIVKGWDRPPFYHTYESMDIGMRDLTAIIFAYYDFRAGKLIIEDEALINGKEFNTNRLAELIKIKESTLWTNPQSGEVLQPFKRVCDNNLILINDLYQLYGLLFEPTRKDDKDAAINNLRIMLAAEKIIIHPRCENLIRHLRDARWNTGKTDFLRSVDTGHFDFVDALIYLVRNINFQANPYPAGYGLYSGDNCWQYNKVKNSTNYAIKQMLNIKSKK